MADDPQEINVNFIDGKLVFQDPKAQRGEGQEGADDKDDERSEDGSSDDSQDSEDSTGNGSSEDEEEEVSLAAACFYAEHHDFSHT